MNDRNPVEDRWNAHYAAGRPPWDLDGPPPVLLELIQTLAQPRRRVLVPCAGYAHDAIAWAAAGHEVVAIDIAPLAVAGAEERAAARGVSLTIEQADLFRLPPEFEASFDIVWEQTCLAAIDPGQRAAYFAAMAAVLKNQGRFYGLIWNHGWKGGPPYDLHLEVLRPLIRPNFEVESWKSVRKSVPSRHREFLLTLVKSPAES